MNHADLPELSIELVREEIVNSKLLNQKHLEIDVMFFAYPYGGLNNNIKGIIENEFSGACSVRLGFVSIESDFYILPRIDMYYLSNNSFLDYIYTSVFSFYIALRKIFRSTRIKGHIGNKS